MFQANFDTLKNIRDFVTSLLQIRLFANFFKPNKDKLRLNKIAKKGNKR